MGDRDLTQDAVTEPDWPVEPDDTPIYTALAATYFEPTGTHAAEDQPCDTP